MAIAKQYIEPILTFAIVPLAEEVVLSRSAHHVPPPRAAKILAKTAFALFLGW
jgi:hypothetical protein